MKYVVPVHQPSYRLLSHMGVDTVEVKRLHDELLPHPDAVGAGLRIWFGKNSGVLLLCEKWLNLSVSVRYDRAARMHFLFRGLNYADIWDAVSGQLLVTAPTDYTFLGSPLAVAEVDTSHNMLAAYRDRGLYEYRYFDNASDVLALANAAL